MGIIGASESLIDKAVTIVQENGAESATGARKGMQGVEIK